MSDIPLAPMERILRKSGVERVSEDACMALRDLLEQKALEVGFKASKLARHAGRVTVKAEDIKLASE
ncbi:MAG: histone [Candidatus Altiarchaeales archaeon]|nr:histone [Candidatus Altiarchaeales archaeon]